MKRIVIRLSFGQIYVLLFALLAVLCAGCVGAGGMLAGAGGSFIQLAVSFGVAAVLLSALFVWALKTKVTAIFAKVDEMIDAAMSGRKRQTGYEETKLSSLEHKLYRYMQLMQERERQVQAERGQIQTLVSDISHQTKTPLAGIRLYSELMGELPQLEEQARMYAAEIQAGAARLDWLIRCLFKLSRLETGLITIQPRLSLLTDTIKSTVSSIQAAAARKDMDIQISCPEVIYAMHDSKWTGEALFNLLENAVKYTPSGGEILVTVQEGEMFVRIDIADTGPGIAESEWAHIFQRFYRSPRVAQVEGIGIGLYLAREIVMAQGGYMKVMSKEQQGSVFSVYLPAILT
ncbi:sensor histidine kinase [Paenibacillus sanguinis]|uniref:sensor histidine kinase n=1 Tax=Paenibacillus sanguinis TaxID=225906 RepID=UPI00035E9A5A|nr:HAMP domain-containing sensor histidine kinase [Paenibacillus sanguinis]